MSEHEVGRLELQHIGPGGVFVLAVVVAVLAVWVCAAGVLRIRR